MVLSDHGSCLTQKQEPHLCLIRPSIDLTSRTMTLSAPDRSPLEIPLDDGRKRLSSYQTRVCNDRQVQDNVTIRNEREEGVGIH